MKKNGFTIIELIIAIFVLSIGIIGVYNVFSMVSILTSDLSDRLTAAYLAQEGMELVRNVRDKNWLDMDGCLATPDCQIGNHKWLDYLNYGSCGNTSIGCEIDYRDSYSNSGEYLNIDSNGLYSYDTLNATPTKFKRKVIINTVTDVDGKSDHIVNVEVHVSWKQKANLLTPGSSDASCGSYNCVKVQEKLYNWYNYKYQ
jgi:prepilin-type N-terminal cleavage/methylation domain-containing protein